ncbi:hypothetical protein SYNPS1DRAFT_31951 [Syncephalis pseudoplumigaleata]|uniref:Uncharacterized protein n=1 Tax=Syncephalis pseudoplumigaleata TaxID=1712513 RepID=A0A4P9YRE3_9FUNG|nr:hypothetical protein SYNPS1DRAFT_31951 [Syncephalis pseudoplumigaleata]|eukprot:RKP22453.1 hypothetical protein SYNPS1DRAFT_31951 [Syncephalis pseudoplumigaleata]
MTQPTTDIFNTLTDIAMHPADALPGSKDKRMRARLVTYAKAIGILSALAGAGILIYHWYRTSMPAHRTGNLRTSSRGNGHHAQGAASTRTTMGRPIRGRQEL